ncbi:hypothetical protein ACJX0J_008367, partial [Zea mays]
MYNFGPSVTYQFGRRIFFIALGTSTQIVFSLTSLYIVSNIISTYLLLIYEFGLLYVGPLPYLMNTTCILFKKNKHFHLLYVGPLPYLMNTTCILFKKNKHFHL